MNNLLLVGNGFDLAHGLLTKYEHFLYILKNWDTFYDALNKIRNGQKSKEKEDIEWLAKQWFGNQFDVDLIRGQEKAIDKFTKHASKMDMKHIEQLGEIINRNSWVYYYCNCEAEIDGWIDFEKEMYPVMELFDFIFNCNYEIVNDRNGSSYIAISLEQCGTKIEQVASFWKRYVEKESQKLYLNCKYASMNYGILKKKILKDLRHEYDEFVRAFELYLVEFVLKRDDVKTLKQIEDIGVTTVISFNYTFMEKLYGVKEEDVHHIHGMLREDLTSGKNNMVMGVNKQDETNMDFIYFVKYFQRIQKASGVKYKELIQKKTQEGNMTHAAYVLHIYGHSLDETDEDILKYVIGDRNAYGGFDLKPEQVVIYYYDDADYEQKVINLIKLYGRSIVEEYMEDEAFMFVKIENECVNTSL